MNRLNLESPNKQMRAEKVRELNALFAAKHMLKVSPRREDIAEAIGIGVDKLDRLTEKRVWGDAVEFWTAGATRDVMPKSEIDLTLTGDMRQSEKLWQEMFDTVPIQEFQKFQHKRLRDGYPAVVWDVDDLKLVNRARRMLHRGVELGFHVLFLITFVEVF